MEQWGKGSVIEMLRIKDHNFHCFTTVLSCKYYLPKTPCVRLLVGWYVIISYKGQIVTFTDLIIIENSWI